MPRISRPSRDVVDSPRHVREEVRVAVRVARDERTDLRALSRLGERGEHGPALEVLAVGIAAQRKEVIPRPERLDAEPFGLEPRGAHVAPVAVLREASGSRSGSRHHSTQSKKLDHNCAVETLPWDWYVSPDVLRREQERIFRETWHYAGPARVGDGAGRPVPVPCG